jgi:ubiquinone/menaquinone biosynthesis C-methylase UbiE
MVEVTAPQPSDRMLDIATGGGHVARAFGSRVASVVIADLTPRMLQEASSFLRDAGLHAIDSVAADAELLPFDRESFDIVTCRIAPHHFPHPERFVSEIARVLAVGGRFALIDSTVPEGDVGEFYNRFELRRDPSHVRSLTVEEWVGLLLEAGLRIDLVESFKKTHDFADWTSRSRTDDAGKSELTAMMRGASAETARACETVWDGETLVSFADEKSLFVASKVTALR